MTKVVDAYLNANGRTLIICDFSPPRGANPKLLEPVGCLDVDFVSVAYNPGKSTRVSSAFAAYWIKANIGKDVVFTLATRDMNKVAVQSLLLGSQLLGLQNVVVVRGDGFNDRELSLVREVNDFTPTELMRSISEMNHGMDFKGLKMRSPTDFCVGASVDLGRDLESEIKLTRRKIEAGAQFLLSQPIFHVERPKEFLTAYAERYSEELSVPVFQGVQIKTAESIVFGDVPRWVTIDLEKGRTGQDIALQMMEQFTDEGFRGIYLVPPILMNGRRDYEAAQSVLEAFGR